jgi:hypothetical protein
MRVAWRSRSASGVPHAERNSDRSANYLFSITGDNSCGQRTHLLDGSRGPTMSGRAPDG